MAERLNISKASVSYALNGRPGRDLARAFHLQTITGIEEELNEIDAGLLLRLVPLGDDQDLAVYRRWVQQGRVDGFILFDERIDDPRPELTDRLGA